MNGLIPSPREEALIAVSYLAQTPDPEEAAIEILGWIGEKLVAGELRLDDLLESV